MQPNQYHFFRLSPCGMTLYMYTVSRIFNATGSAFFIVLIS